MNAAIDYFNLDNRNEKVYFKLDDQKWQDLTSKGWKKNDMNVVYL